ncbi:MAG TPA: hypothetical protein PKH92_03825 [Anaerolineaceae bacterium]|nr:hypothetical protein [Anaerolineaceae bacterium]HNS36809.1 hypothetical protein [Anaerolineaceae bacterium]HNZ12643.1 hypothetical protein [Anaerolineaceae bacterium]HOD04153.1 hypothetical protein [Anaerolineaceae bacterium]HOG78344.1 hypothetical protein [Anaerolineaceae bacterium]
MAQNLIQAYRQAPWRTQLQWIGLFLLGLVGVVLVAGLWLSITAQATSAGVEIQNLEYDREDIQREIADLKTHYAYLTSAAVMEDRAEGLGYVTADMTQAVYVIVPGYVGRQPEILALPITLEAEESEILKPSYTQSLWDILFRARLWQGSIQP